MPTYIQCAVYMYDRKEVNVETDHRPLDMIMREPHNSVPKQLQRMLPQKYVQSGGTLQESKQIDVPGNSSI